MSFSRTTFIACILLTLGLANPVNLALAQAPAGPAKPASQPWMNPSLDPTPAPT